MTGVVEPERPYPLFRLDRDFYPVIVHRIASAKYADLSGIGAALYPGRWNRKGEPAIYASTEVGTAVLERLVHTNRHEIPTGLAHMQIQILGPGLLEDGAMVTALRVCETVEEGMILFDSETTYGVSAVTFCIAVPSVVSPRPACNLVFYPSAAGFRDLVELYSVQPLELDARLFSS